MLCYWKRVNRNSVSSVNRNSVSSVIRKSVSSVIRNSVSSVNRNSVSSVQVHNIMAGVTPVHCQNYSQSKGAILEGLTQLCLVEPVSNGEFSFPVVFSDKYKLVPFIKVFIKQFKGMD